ncbi:MAG: flagellar hook assembly protein FlgD [Proteobacteria bacterium]|nr:flagellar hook assembly protein FlgD [Pseudomonadota bacterium]NOG58920.1 flagellar hook assembly protein FlgD [Pseudomonadota bacterium]
MADSNTILPAELQHLTLKQPEKKENEGLGQDAFLELMLTQIQHQDPLNPMESSDFLSQMAQFGTVNGITELNSSFATLSGSLQSNQALQASTMVGNTVLVPSSKAALVSGTEISGAIELNSSTSNLVINISDASGQSVRQVDFGSHTSGLTKFSWDGLDNNGNALPTGQYTIEAAALVNGEPVAQSVLINAKVDSVTLNKTGGEPLLNLNGIGTVSINEIREIM